jgi:hypothetical protein
MAKARKKAASKGSATQRVILPRGADGGRVASPGSDPAVTVKAEPKGGWLSRLFGTAKPKTAKVDAGQMAQLRESVMQEYRARAAQEMATGESRPFARPLLPEGAMGGRAPRGGGDWLFTGFVLVSLAVIVLLLVQGGRKPEGPEGALAGLHKALEQGDDRALVRSVDVTAVSEDVVSQLFGSGVLPPVSGTALVQPGLAATLAEEMNMAVVEGAVYGDGTSLLKQLWQQAGGDHLQLGKPRVVTRNQTSAVAEMLITRDDTGQVGEILQLSLAKQGEHWRVVGAPNLGPVMAKLSAIAAAMPDATELAALGAIEPASGTRGGMVGLTPALAVTAVEKSSGSVSKTMRLRISYANQGGQAVPGVKVRVTIGDARGVPLRVIDLEDTSRLEAGAKRSRELNVPVNGRDNIQAAVAKLPLSALSVQSTARALN